MVEEKLFKEGNDAFSRGQFRKAAEAYEQALSSCQDEPALWYNYGCALMELEQYEEALVAFRRASELKPEMHIAWFNMGNILTHLGRYDEAVGSYDNAIKARPEHYPSWNNRGCALAREGDYREALESYNRALEIKPDYRPAYYNRAYTYAKLGRLEEASEIYESVLQLRAEDAAMWNNRGYVLTRAERYEEALQCFERAIKLKPDHHKAWYNRGYVMTELNRYEEALESYKKAVEILPDYGTAIYNKGYVLIKMGRIQEAADAFSEYANLCPVSEYTDLLRQLVARLRQLVGQSMRVIVALFLLQLSSMAQVLQSAKPEVQPAAEVLLSLDNGVASDSIGGNGQPGFGWFNLLKPDSYPATLKEVHVAFNSGQQGVPSGAPFRILIFVDPEADGLNPRQQPVQILQVTANRPGNFERYEVPKPVTIESGAFIIGPLDSILVARLPALINIPGTAVPAGSRSYYTLDNGQTFQNVAATFPGFGLKPGSWLIRALVEIPTPQPIITRAFYRKNKLRIIGKHFGPNVVVRINGERVRKSISFDPAEGKYTIKGTREELNLNPSGQSNSLVVIVDGVASEVFQFTT
ncbi:MAG: tetratricopeptide repeat protein [Acidobacteriota bacterium]|nr:tetratricopeptide repeat protein [Blastocatellia bacterium]MDW8411452.1 tetratricopeptide repeat protein [Acidobacteriota bacterium]